MKDTRDMMVKDYDTCTDEELIARLRAGEREITDYLIDKMCIRDRICANTSDTHR